MHNAPIQNLVHLNANTVWFIREHCKSEKKNLKKYPSIGHNQFSEEKLSVAHHIYLATILLNTGI